MSSFLGKKAPEFSLQNGNFKNISLSNHFKVSNVLLLFYPLSFSNVCTKELCQTRDNLKFYDALDTSVIAISVDSVFVQRAFKASQNLNFEVLSDFNKEVSKTYGAFYDSYFGMNGVSKRAAFIIDKEGIVRYEEILEDSELLPNFFNIQSVLSELA